MINAKNIIKKYDNMHYINKNYVLQPIYNDANECLNDTDRTIRVCHVAPSYCTQKKVCKPF